MRPSIIHLVAILGILGSAQAENIRTGFQSFDFATSDINGRYTMLDLRQIQKNYVETLVRRTSLKSGDLTFTKRIVDCRNMRAQTIEQGEDLSNLTALT